MRIINALGLAAALLGAAIPARAQQDTVPQEIAEARLPADVAERVTPSSTIPAPSTSTAAPASRQTGRCPGPWRCSTGPFAVAGRVDGDVVVINGDLEFLPGAVVAGSVTVVGGQDHRGRQRPRAGETNAYSAPLEYVRTGERLVLQEPATVGDSTGEGTTLRPPPRQDAPGAGHRGELQPRGGASHHLRAGGGDAGAQTRSGCAPAASFAPRRRGRTEPSAGAATCRRSSSWAEGGSFAWAAP
jgi:hypothetical protein